VNKLKYLLGQMRQLGVQKVPKLRHFTFSLSLSRDVS